MWLPQPDQVIFLQTGHSAWLHIKDSFSGTNVAEPYPGGYVLRKFRTSRIDEPLPRGRTLPTGDDFAFAHARR